MGTLGPRDPSQATSGLGEAPGSGTVRDGKDEGGDRRGDMRGCKQLVPRAPPVSSHQSLANMTSATVRVSRLLSLPPEAFEMPLTADPKFTVTISPPLAHSGPGPVLVRLISYDLREGQVGDNSQGALKAPLPRHPPTSHFLHLLPTPILCL